MSPVRVRARRFVLVGGDETLARDLERAGQFVVVASDEGTAAAAASTDESVAFVVVDLGPPPSPSEVAGIVAMLVALPVPPLVIATALSPDVATVKSALNAGASYFLERPFDAADLLATAAHLEKQPSVVSIWVDRTLAKLRLTARELEIARLLLKGLTAIEIASAIGISDKTVRQHVCRVYEKSGVSSRPEFFNHVFAF